MWSHEKKREKEILMNKRKRKERRQKRRKEGKENDRIFQKSLYAFTASSRET